MPFGDLKHQLPEIDGRIAEDRLHVIDDAVIAEVPLKQIDGHLHVGHQRAEFAEIELDLLHQRQRHWNGQARHLGIVDESAGRHQFSVLLFPAAQHLAAHQFAGPQIDHRLVIRLDFATGDAALQVERRHLRAPHIVQGQHQERCAHQARHNCKTDVEIGIAAARHGKGQGVFHLERQFAGKALRVDELGGFRPPVKTRRIADRHDRGTIGQRYPQHGARFDALGQRALGLAKQRHECRYPSQLAKRLGDLERRHIHVAQLDQRDGLGAPGHRQCLGQRPVIHISPERIAVLHAIGVLDQDLFHVETGLDRHLHIGHKGWRTQRRAIGQNGPQRRNGVRRTYGDL